MMTKTMGTTAYPVVDRSTMQPITAREMMVRNLITLEPDMDALVALDILLRQRISGAPVVDSENRFLGIFSEKSCMQFVVGLAYDGLPSTEVLGLTDRNPPTIDEETDLLTIAQTFLNEACRRLPVLDSEGCLRGQISRRDIMRAIRSHVQTRPNRPNSSSGLYISALFAAGQRPL